MNADFFVNSTTPRLDKINLRFEWEDRPVAPVVNRHTCTNSMGRAQIWQVPDTETMRESSMHEVGKWIVMIDGACLFAADGTYNFEGRSVAQRAAEDTMIHQAAEKLRQAAALLGRID